MCDQNQEKIMKLIVPNLGTIGTINLDAHKWGSELNSWNAFQIRGITGKQRIKFPIPAIYFV